MLQDPVLRSLFIPPMPLFTVYDVQSSTADLTTYTFTDLNLPPLMFTGGTGETNTDAPRVRNSNKGFTLIGIHQEAAAVTWTITSATLGGQVGTMFSRGGATTAINSGMAYWTGIQREAMTNSTLVIVNSKALTCCAVGVVGVRNICVIEQNAGAGASAIGTGTLTLGVGPSNSRRNAYQWMFACTTSPTGGGTENAGALIPAISASPLAQLMYEGSNAEINYAGFAVYGPQYDTESSQSTQMAIDWSGTASTDMFGIPFD